MLHSCIITPDADDYPNTVHHWFKTNDKADAYNTHVYQLSTFNRYIVNSVGSVVGTVSDEMAAHIITTISVDSRKTMQLPSEFEIAVNGRYEISKNLNLANGANGASVIVKKVQLAGSDSSASGTVWILFYDPIIGRNTRSDSKHMHKEGIDVHWTPINRVSRQFQVGRGKNVQVIQKQFPLRHSAAKTI